MKHSAQQGFTLVELMIATTLGLLIVAAATQLFISGLVSVTVQRAMADLQDSANFGINAIRTDLRKVNYKADSAQITAATHFAGVVLSLHNFPADLIGRPDGSLLTKSAAEATSSQLTDVASDQLTVQFYTDIDTFDCEGNTVFSGSMIVQRYFIENGHLKCDAAQYRKHKPTEKNIHGAVTPYALVGMHHHAQVLLKNVEYMRILLAVSEDKLVSENRINDPIPANRRVQNHFRYIDINDYPSSGKLPRIRGIQLGLLLRANDRIAPSQHLADTNAAGFRVLDKDIHLRSKDEQYLHQVLTQTIAFRHAMGASS